MSTEELLDKASARTWRADREFDFLVMDNRGEAILDLLGNNRAVDKELVLRAVNSFAIMREALKKIIETDKRIASSMPTEIIMQAEDALALADHNYSI